MSLAGAVVGAAYRVVTSGVIGANISAGFALWAGVQEVVALVVKAARLVRAAELSV